MALTALTRRLGRGQGRVRIRDAAEGEYAFVLGDDEPGHLVNLAPGDHAEVTQTTDLTGAALLRVSLRLRVPARTPTGFGWEAALLVDGVKAARMRVLSGRERLVTDLAANVSKLSGMHVVSVRLELVTT